MLCTSELIDSTGNNNYVNMGDISGLDYGSMLIRMIVALGIVLLLSYIALRFMKKYYSVHMINKSNKLISGIAEVYRIDRNSYFGILKVCDSYFLFHKGTAGVNAFQLLDGKEVEKYLEKRDIENES